MILKELLDLTADIQYNTKQYNALRENVFPTKPEFQTSISGKILAEKLNQAPDEIKLIFEYIFNDDQFLDQIKALYLQGKILAGDELAAYRVEKTNKLTKYDQDYYKVLDHNNRIQKQKNELSEDNTKGLASLVYKWSDFISELEIAVKNQTLTNEQLQYLSVLDKHSKLVKYVDGVYDVEWEKLKVINHAHILQILRSLANGNY